MQTIIDQSHQAIGRAYHNSVVHSNRVRPQHEQPVLAAPLDFALPRKRRQWIGAYPNSLFWSELEQRTRIHRPSSMVEWFRSLDPSSIGWSATLMLSPMGCGGHSPAQKLVQGHDIQLLLRAIDCAFEW